MLGQALALILLLLPKRYQGQEFLDSAVHVVGLSGKPLRLQPLSMQTEANSDEWKVQLPSKPGLYQILSWKNGSTKIDYEDWILKDFKNRLTFTIENLTLLIKAAQQQDSGLYILEVTDSSGKVWRRQFQVSVFGESPGLLALPL
uniref:Natural killer cell receptor 2B4 immunoglobulin domain-containing protein n=1 Tax=Equus asinus asinus TaxID=83772 RepID=A0A8C4KY89_EQUAS